MDKYYSKQPALLIGLGGVGSEIVSDVYSGLRDKQNIEAFSVDIGIAERCHSSTIPQKHCIDIAPGRTLYSLLAICENAREWFPRVPLKNDSWGVLARVVSRLYFECALSRNLFNPLLDNLRKLVQDYVDSNDRLRICIVTSLVGSTGSGIFIQMALLIRKYISNYFSYNNVEIHGEFILPSSFSFVSSSVERNVMEANTYAALKELNAINQQSLCVSSFPELRFDWDDDSITSDNDGLLPYDYCFLYNKVAEDRVFNKTYVVEAINQRLFGEYANVLNKMFADGVYSLQKKQKGAVYGVVCVKRIENMDLIMNSNMFFDTIDRIDCKKEKSVIVLARAHEKSVDTGLLSENTTLIEITDVSDAQDIIIQMDYGIDISKIKKMCYKTGQYYMSYKNLIKNIPQGVLTPHLHKDWHMLIDDIGEYENI